jgi:hypothetical protein
VPSSRKATVETLVEACRDRGHAVLAGEPGVGKTCVQRIEQVAVGGSEDLIVMGFRPVSRDERLAEALIRYEVRSEDGVVDRGEFRIVQRSAGAKTVSKKDVLGRPAED